MGSPADDIDFTDKFRRQITSKQAAEMDGKNKMDTLISQYLNEVGMQYTAQDAAGMVKTYN